MAEDPFMVVAAITLHGVPSSAQLNVKSLAKPSPSAADAVDLRPPPADSISSVANMKLGSPRVNFDRPVSIFHVPTKGSGAANKTTTEMRRRNSFRIGISTSLLRM